jgi:hypothetical protein
MTWPPQVPSWCITWDDTPRLNFLGYVYLFMKELLGRKNR